MTFLRLAAATLLLLFSAIAASPSLAAEPLLHPMFQDHAVLQRDKPIRVWGQAIAGATVTVSIAQTSVQAQSDGKGRWAATLPEMAAGGPYTLTAAASTGESQTVHDVLIGDVWLCSGQSNMALQVSRTLDAPSEIGNSANNNIRMMTVNLDDSVVPLDSFSQPAKWLVAGPTTVPDFSAACFYFARELQKAVHVPMGLVTAASGGANITTWMSPAALRAVGGYDEYLDLLKLHAGDPQAAMKRWGAMWEAWWLKRDSAQTTPWTSSFDDSQWPVAPSGLGNWQEWNIPALTDFAGQLWYRSSVTLTASQAAQSAELSLGSVNEEDETWVNGEPVGNMFGFGKERTYKLPAGSLQAGANSIVVNVLCTYHGCGLIGANDKRALRLSDGTSVPLNGPWRYQIGPENETPTPRAPWGATAGLGMAYNAMIVPIGSYGFRGVVWYQGESNEGMPGNYRALLSGLMADWRSQFGAASAVPDRTAARLPSAADQARGFQLGKTARGSASDGRQRCARRARRYDRHRRTLRYSSAEQAGTRQTAGACRAPFDLQRPYRSDRPRRTAGAKGTQSCGREFCGCRRQAYRLRRRLTDRL